MKTQLLSIGLTVVNLGFLAFLLLSYRSERSADGVAAVVRGRALQIVDDQGRT